MAIIRNSDYSVGQTRRLNQYEMDSAEAQRFRFNQILKDSAQKDPYKHGAKKANWDEVLTNGKPAPQNSPEMFNLKLQEFFFSPPSDNLWNVEISLSTYSFDGDKSKAPASAKQTSLLQLYTNIEAVNDTWNKLNAEGWKIDVSPARNKSKKTPQDFLRHLCDSQIGVFLAQRVNFNPITLNIDTNPFGEIKQHGGFYKNAKVIKSREDDDKLRINFLVSNWDITEILIDPWIAAMSQHGLIADDIVLKAKIVLTEYSASHEKFSSEETYSGIMEARKQYIFDNCFPISRESPEKIYETDEAGKYKTSIVTFSYDSYKINYLF